MNYKEITDGYLSKYNCERLEPNKKEHCYSCPNLSIIVCIHPSSKRTMRKFLHEVGHIAHKMTENPLIDELNAELFCYNELKNINIENSFIKNKIYIHSAIICNVFNGDIKKYFKNISIKSNFNQINSIIKVYDKNKCIFKGLESEIKKQYNEYYKIVQTSV